MPRARSSSALSGRILSLSGPTGFCGRRRLFGPGGARPRTEMMVSFIADHRDAYGVEPICQQLPIAPSSYYEHKAWRVCPERLPDHARRDTERKQHIEYGARKIWHQLRREGTNVARCMVEHLMREMGVQGVSRGAYRRTTHPATITVCPDDLVGGGSTPSVRTSCGWPTSPMSRPGSASSTPPS